MKKLKVAILRETKTPPDRRTALAPHDALSFQKKFPNIELIIQSSEIRAYTDAEYLDLGLTVQPDVSHCDILIGVKEVEIEALLPNKTYLFFSHTAKKQPYNKPLLQAIIDKKITLIDYEYLTNPQGQRLVAFGRWAGIVGAYNALLGYGQRSGAYHINRAHTCYDMPEVFQQLQQVKLPNNYKIVLTGGGRVAAGAMEILDKAGLEKVSPQHFLTQTFDKPVYTQLDPWHYNTPKNGEPFDFAHFIKAPADFESTFAPYTAVADMYIAGHFWAAGAPMFINADDYLAPNFRIKLIADISCDILEPIASTLRPSTIEEPFYGYQPKTKSESPAFEPNAITVMAVDNLPGEAPRSASVDFGRDLMDRIYPSLFGTDKENIIKRASITQNGVLTPNFAYLEDWLHEE